jgi:hypothetical protein
VVCVGSKSLLEGLNMDIDLHNLIMLVGKNDMQAVLLSVEYTILCSWHKF